MSATTRFDRACGYDDLLLDANAGADLIAEGADLAIRLDELDGSAFGARKLATLSTMLAASPVYLAARGTPKTPADLTSHACSRA